MMKLGLKMNNKNGESAFPLIIEVNPDAYAQAKGMGMNINKFIIHNGMTLRDYFAAKAMQGFLSVLEPTYEQPNFKVLAKDSFEMADAMLIARED